MVQSTHKLILGLSIPGRDLHLATDEDKRLSPPQGVSGTSPSVAPGAGGDRGVALSLYLHLFWRYRLLILAAVVATAVVTVIVHYALPEEYMASVLILPPQEPNNGVSEKVAAVLGDNAGGLLRAEGTVAQHVDILESQRTLDLVAERLGLGEYYGITLPDDLRGALSGQVGFEVTRGKLIKISVVNHSPEMAARIANEFVEVLAEIHHEINKGKVGREREFLEERVAEVERDLRASQDAWRAFQEKHRLIRVDEGLRATATVMGELEARRIAKEIELQVTETVYAKESPEVEVLKTEVNRLATKLEELAKTGIRPVDGDGEHQWLFPAVTRVPSLALEQMELERRLALHAKLYELLATQLELARIAEARELTSIEVVSPATPPGRPCGSCLKLRVTVALSVVVLAILAVGFLVLSDPALAARALGTGKAGRAAADK